MPFDGPVALVTGSTKGIGRAVASLLANRGVHVLVTGRDAGQGRQVVEDIGSEGGTAHFLEADLRDADACRRLAASALQVGGRVDILVNNAAIATHGATAALTEVDFDESFAVNVRAPFILVGVLAPQMAARGGGSIVNVTTMVAALGTAGASIYASSKAALNHLTKCWAAEFGPHGVRVNAVAPNPTLTENAEAFFGVDGLTKMMSRTPARRVADPIEIAHAIAYLTSDQAGFVHGAVLPVDGGRTAV